MRRSPASLRRRVAQLDQQSRTIERIETDGWNVMPYRSLADMVLAARDCEVEPTGAFDDREVDVSCISGLICWRFKDAD